jgi:hypothetical protein
MLYVLYVRSDPVEPERSRNPQRTRERPATLRKIETSGVGVQVRPPTRLPAANVRKEFTTDHDNTQKVGPRRPGSASDTGTDRLRTTRHVQSIPSRRGRGRP